MSAKQPAPSILAKVARTRTPKKKRSPITFRLSEGDEAALHALAKGVGLGPSSFARRIVENYIQQQVPRTRARGKRR